MKKDRVKEVLLYGFRAYCSLKDNENNCYEDCPGEKSEECFMDFYNITEDEMRAIRLI